MRLIDADELKTAFPCGESVRTESVRATIDHMATVEAEPVRHGRWMKNGDRYCECSVCHHEGNMSGQDSYCWNCGAKMDAPTQKSVGNALDALDALDEVEE